MASACAGAFDDEDKITGIAAYATAGFHCVFSDRRTSVLVGYCYSSTTDLFWLSRSGSVMQVLIELIQHDVR
jgi:hypothetical protein